MCALKPFIFGNIFSRIEKVVSTFSIFEKILLKVIKGLFGYNRKLKTEKQCSKIIFKCVNSTVKPIFNFFFLNKMVIGPMNST